MLVNAIFNFLTLIAISNFASHNTNPIDITNQCVFNEKQILSYCYWHGAMFIEELIITNQSDFEKYGSKIKNSSSRCETATLPVIDFNKYMLVSKITQSGCCVDQYKRSVLRYKDEKKLVYTIEVNYEGTCEKMCFNYNWVKIPKMPDEYKIEFEIISKKT